MTFVRIALIVVPYDSRMRGARMGAGPEALLEAGMEISTLLTRRAIGRHPGDSRSTH